MRFMAKNQEKSESRDEVTVVPMHGGYKVICTSPYRVGNGVAMGGGLQYASEVMTKEAAYEHALEESNKKLRNLRKAVEEAFDRLGSI
jgi:hypothetical protein